MKIAFDARLEGAERADWWRALTDALPDDDWIDAAVEGTQSARWREAEVAVVANPLPGRLAGCTRLTLIQSLWAGVDRLLADATLPATHVFWFHPRVTIWPHAAAQTDLRSAAAVVAANVEAVRRGDPAAHLVDRSRGY